MNIPKPAFEMDVAAPVAAAPTPAPVQINPAPVAPQEPLFNLETLVMKYRDLRDKKKEVQDSIKESVAQINEAMEQLENVILNHLNTIGADSMKTKSGTAYKSTRTSYTVKDPALFREWIAENARFDLLETRVSKEAIENLIETGATLPPGLGISSDITLNVRK